MKLICVSLSGCISFAPRSSIIHYACALYLGSEGNFFRHLLISSPSLSPSPRKVDGKKLEQGMAFERHVRSLLDVNIRVTRWTKMQWARGPRADEGSFDFCLRDTARERGFFLECIYRSGLREGKLFFHAAEKIGRWQEASGRLGMPVCVAVGIGGSPENTSCSSSTLAA